MKDFGCACNAPPQALSFMRTRFHKGKLELKSFVLAKLHYGHPYNEALFALEEQRRSKS
jgi:hypothetical protein